MNKEQVTELQKRLAALGLYSGDIDGLWGRQSAAALDALFGLAQLRDEKGLEFYEKAEPMAWGKKVSSSFRDKVSDIVKSLGMEYKGAADDLMTAMAFETGRTFSPSVKNAAGSGAVGLIQFMPSTARGLGTTTDALSKMTALDQLDYVYRYFLPYKGRLKTLGDVYMAILWPAAVEKPSDYVLWDKNVSPITYSQNSGLDKNKDGKVTKGEIVEKIIAMRVEGMRSENFG